MQRPKITLELSEENVMELIAHHYNVDITNIDLIFGNGDTDEEPPKFRVRVTNPDLARFTTGLMEL